jgi:hypothetical protein
LIKAYEEGGEHEATVGGKVTVPGLERQYHVLISHRVHLRLEEFFQSTS